MASVVQRSRTNARVQRKWEIFENRIYCPDLAASFNICVSTSRNLWPARV